MRALWALAALSITLAGGCHTFQVSPADPTAPTLNSERIQQRFGSYDIELLRQNAQLRVSNLYSTHAGQRICRTLAIVRFISPVPAALESAHTEILAGGSIGAVLNRNGWQVIKRRLELSQIEVPEGSRAAVLMRLPEPTPLATDLYELSAQQGEGSFRYAVIAEIHHPDHMTLTKLHSLAIPQEADRGTSRMLRLAKQIATETP